MNEEILNIAAEHYFSNIINPNRQSKEDNFKAGATSYAAKEYWFAQFQSQQKQLSDEESAAIVKELAEWSKRYPRGITYSSSRQPKMDGELIALEERAKKWLETTNPTT